MKAGRLQAALVTVSMLLGFFFSIEFLYYSVRNLCDLIVDGLAGYLAWCACKWVFNGLDPFR